jgi:hypothetical protein
LSCLPRGIESRLSSLVHSSDGHSTFLGIFPTRLYWYTFVLVEVDGAREKLGTLFGEMKKWFYVCVCFCKGVLEQKGVVTSAVQCKAWVGDKGGSR